MKCFQRVCGREFQRKEVAKLTAFQGTTPCSESHLSGYAETGRPQLPVSHSHRIACVSILFEQMERIKEGISFSVIQLHPTDAYHSI